MSGVVAVRGEKPFIPNAKLPDIIRAHEEANSLPLTTKAAVSRWVAQGDVPHTLAGRRILVPADAPAVRDAAKTAAQFGSIQPSKFIRGEALAEASGLPQAKLDRGLKRLEPSPFVAVDGAPLFERPALEAAGLLPKPVSAGRSATTKAVARGGGKGAAAGAAKGEAMVAAKAGGRGKLILAGTVVASALAAKVAVSSTYPADNGPTRNAAGWGAAGGIAASAGAIALLAKRAPVAAAAAKEARSNLRFLKGPALAAVATAGFMMTSDNSPTGAAARMAGPAAVLTGVASLPFLIKGGRTRAAASVLKLAVPVAAGAVAANVIGNLTSPDAPAPKNAEVGA